MTILILKHARNQKVSQHQELYLSRKMICLASQHFTSWGPVVAQQKDVSLFLDEIGEPIAQQ